MSIPKALRRPTAVAMRLSARFRAEARMLVRYCELARQGGFDATGHDARAIETVEAYATTLELWCLGERTPQALKRRYTELPDNVWPPSGQSSSALFSGPSVQLVLAVQCLDGRRCHLCQFPTHSPAWWELTSPILERIFVDLQRLLLGGGSAETVRGEYATTLRAVEREDVERARVAKLPIEALAATSATKGKPGAKP